MAPTTDPVLIVDDHEDTRRLLTELLELEGYVVATASTGAEALAQLRLRPYCLVLLDLGLPDVSGVELVGDLRRALVAHGTRDGSCPIYALSGFSHLYAEALAAGCDGFLLKPVLATELRSVLGLHCATSPPPQAKIA